NLEFFSQNPETTDGALGGSLGKQLFTSRLELISAIDRKLGASAGYVERVQEPAASYDVAMTEEHLRRELAELLRQQVAAMNLGNFIVRPKRRLVEKYAKPEAWSTLQEEDFGVLTRDVAGLPSELADEDQLGNEITLELPGFGSGADFERFRAKTRQFLRQHDNHLTIHKLRWNMPLTPADIGELERMLVEAGVGTSADLSRATQESRGL